MFDKSEFSYLVMADLIGHLYIRFPVKPGMTVKFQFIYHSVPTGDQTVTKSGGYKKEDFAGCLRISNLQSLYCAQSRKQTESPRRLLCGGFSLKRGGAEEARTLDLRRDRPAF